MASGSGLGEEASGLGLREEASGLHGRDLCKRLRASILGLVTW